MWSDSPDNGPTFYSLPTEPFRSSTDNQLAVRSRGGVVFKVGTTNVAANAADSTPGCSLPAGGAAAWSCSSDRNLKEAIVPISARDVLSKVIAMPLSTWQFKGTARRHLSPMAQDFHSAFGLGSGDTSITASDVSGVALAAIQGLNQSLQSEIKAKNLQLSAQRKEMDAMKAELAAIRKKLGL